MWVCGDNDADRGGGAVDVVGRLQIEALAGQLEDVHLGVSLIELAQPWSSPAASACVHMLEELGAQRHRAIAALQDLAVSPGSEGYRG